MTLENIFRKKKVYFMMLLLSLWFGCVPSHSFSLPVSSYEQKDSYVKDREVVDSFLAKELISKKLSEMGLSKDEVNERLNKLSGDQLHNLAVRLERIKVGSDGGWVIALIIVLLFVGTVLFFLTHNIHVEPKEPQTK